MSADRAAQLVEAGIWLKLSGDLEGAKKLFERALKLDPQNEKAAELLAGGAAPGEEITEEPEKLPSAPPVAPSIGSHPFERSDSGSGVRSEWEVAAKYGSGASSESGVNLEEDWGRMTGAKTPVPQRDPSAPAPQSDPGPFVSSSPSQKPSTLVFGPSGSASSQPKSNTMQLFPQNEPAPKSTMQLFPQSETPAPRQTMQLFKADLQASQPARSIEIGGDPGPDAPPSSTPPLFGYGPSSDSSANVVTKGGIPTPSPSTPALFASLNAAAAPAPKKPEPAGNAWAWSASPTPNTPKAPEPTIDAPVGLPGQSDEELPPVPRPSPSLAPRAESAWDVRSNPGIKLEAVAGRDRALDLISSDSKITRSPESRKEEIRAILRGARDLLDLDDHSGAMELILKAQDIAPDDPEVIAMRERSEKTLLIMFESKLGKLETIPRVLLKDDEIIWLNLDHRAGFVLAQIDGTVSFDDLFSVSGMSRIDTARILAQLVEEGVISRG